MDLVRLYVASGLDQVVDIRVRGVFDPRHGATGLAVPCGRKVEEEDIDSKDQVVVEPLLIWDAR
jgi:hypothetical protein